MQLDLVEKKAKNWYEEGAVPSEPFFVARPGATEEDDGDLNLPSSFVQYIPAIAIFSISCLNIRST